MKDKEEIQVLVIDLIMIRGDEGIRLGDMIKPLIKFIIFSIFILFYELRHDEFYNGNMSK